MDSSVSRPPAESLSQIAYRELRSAIVSGRLRPNERLVESELAERLSISRTPIREALARLADEHMIESLRRGWAVREHTAAEIREIFEARAALEGFAAKLAAERATDDELASIVAIVERDRSTIALTPELTIRHNDEFHASISKASRNERLMDLIRRNNEFYFNYRLAPLYTAEETLAAFVGHEDLATYLQRRDPVRAEAIARRHVLESIDLILSKLW